MSDMITAQVTHLSTNAANITVGLIAGFVVLAGVVTALGRSRLEGSYKARSGGAQGQGANDQAGPDRTFMRSWLAISLVGGLLIFSAVSFQLDDTTLRSSLLGGVIASAGAATAFYFASKSADQARQDILNASVPSTATPNLIGHTKSEVNAALAGTPLYLDPAPTAAGDDWVALSQDPPPNQQTATGSRVHVAFAGKVPDLRNQTFSSAQTLLNGLNLVLAAKPSGYATNWIAQDDQVPVAGSAPTSDRTVTVTFQQPPPQQPPPEQAQPQP
jgi:hypothetical protein